MPEEPEAYREGWVPFLGLTIWLDSKPLIPRPETEWWVEQVILKLGDSLFEYADFSAEKLLLPLAVARGGLKNETAKFSVLDLCAGSGAIGCAFLKYLPQARVCFGEIDPAHEATILKNIRENNLDESRAEIKIGDLFEPFKSGHPMSTFDVIVANPPYIPDGRVLDPSVALYEPALALRAGSDGLAVIRRIAKELPRRLKKGGAAWVECDIENIEAARELFAGEGFTADIKNDQYDRPRIVVISF